MAAVLALGAACSQRHHEVGPDLTAVPAGVHWSDYEGVQLPQGVDGPREITRTATGFTHTPRGAALAAIVHTTRMSLAPDDDWAQVLRVEVAPGPAKDTLSTSRILLHQASRAAAATAPRIRGYTLTAYTPTTAHVRIYTSYPDRSIQLNLAQVVWLGGDWRLQLPALDSTAPVVKSVTAMAATVRLEAPQ